jgi:iron complex outermembrane receptor protein
MNQLKNKRAFPAWIPPASGSAFRSLRQKSGYALANDRPRRRRGFVWLPRLACVLAAWLMALPAHGQELKDTIADVRIESARPQQQPDLRTDFSAGQQNQAFDSSTLPFYQGRSLNHLLAEQSPVFVKQYGVNSMATIGFRGASAAQSAVLWNGIPISSPAMGVSDVSVLNAGLFDHISLQYGGSSALFGSGNVGGALLLEEEPADFTKKEQLSLSLGLGSFGQKETAAKALYQNSRWRFMLHAFYQLARNDFSYSGNNGQELRMDNARMRGAGAIFSADYNLGKPGDKPDETLSLRLWFQRFDREIPPALFESFSVKKQADQSLRSLLQWQKKTAGSRWYVKLSLNRDKLQYQDGVVLPDNTNEALQVYGELGWSWKVNQPRPKAGSAFFPFFHELLLFSPLQYEVASSENLAGAPSRFRPAIAAAYRVRSADGKLKANMAFREEWTLGHAPVALPGAGLLYQLLHRTGKRNSLNLALRLNVQRAYRLPGLNELYFEPGGNDQLKPERGWNEDGGFTFQWKWNKSQTDRGAYRWVLTQESAVFNRDIHDWIYWLGGAIWTPHNLAEVHSRGLETENSIAWQQSKTRLRLALKTAYVLSTTLASYLPGDGSIGKQIPYTPRYNGRIGLSLQTGPFLINYDHSYTGYRFVTVDESQFLEPYQTGNIQALYTFRRTAYELQCALQVLNIWDTPYEIVNGRPMPGRQFLLRLQLVL